MAAVIQLGVRLSVGSPLFVQHAGADIQVVNQNYPDRALRVTEGGQDPFLTKLTVDQCHQELLKHPQESHHFVEFKSDFTENDITTCKRIDFRIIFYF